MLQMSFPTCEGIDHPLWTVCLLEHLSTFCNFVIYLKWFIFSRYWSFLDWRKDTSSGDELSFKRFLDSIFGNQPRPAHFFAYFHPRCLSILNLICCPALNKEQVIRDLEKRGISISNWEDGSSKKDMIPGRDKAFVFVSGGIWPCEEKEMEDFYLK